MSDNLNVHPAGVLVMVIVMAQLVGFIGVLLSAPILASLLLFFKYAFRKLMDLDPWENMPAATASKSSGFTIKEISIKFNKLWRKIWSLLVKGFQAVKNLFHK